MAIEAISNSVNKVAVSTGTKTISSPTVATPAKTNVTERRSDPIESADTEPAVISDTYQSGEDNSKNQSPSDSTIKQAISDINKKINPNTVAEYGYHEGTKRVTIKIVDKDTDKVIREYPAEETLDMIAKVWELAGMFVDEKG